MIQEKTSIRKKAFVNRKKKYFEISPQFFDPLILFLKKKNNNNNVSFLSIYYPSNFEVNVLNLFQPLKKIKIKTLLPIIKFNNQMNFVEWQFLDPLKVNEFGMLEPCLKKKSLVPNVMLIPLLAFDSNNN